MNVRTITGLAALAFFFALLPANARAEIRELLLAAYSLPKDAYEKRIIPAFVQQWKQESDRSTGLSGGSISNFPKTSDRSSQA